VEGVAESFKGNHWRGEMACGVARVVFSKLRRVAQRSALGSASALALAAWLLSLGKKNRWAVFAIQWTSLAFGLLGCGAVLAGPRPVPEEVAG